MHLNKPEKETDPQPLLKNIGIKNANWPVIAQLTINILRNKFKQSSAMVSGNINIFMISETILDVTFSAVQFSLKGFCHPYQFDFKQD